MKERGLILVVDDETDFLHIISRILTAKGFRVETAATAAGGLEKARAGAPNAAILDISLPDNDGTELLSELLMIHPDIIAIMLTGHSSAQSAMKSLNRGAFAYLEKPLDPEHLLSVIGQGLEKQQLVVENRQLVEKLERHNRETNILLTVSQAVSQSLEISEIINHALAKVAESLGVDASFAYLLDEGNLVLAGHWGLPSDVVTALEQTEANQDVASWIHKQREPVIVSSIRGHDEPALRALAGHGYHSYAGVPLAMAGRNIGVISVATRTERGFTEGEVNLLTAIGREISIAVQNARLYEEASSARALRELDTMRTEFLANVSHELRTPLAVIKGSANSLLQDDVIFDEDTWREFIQSIDSDADSLTRLVDDLLVMSRLEAGALGIDRKEHRLEEIVGAVKDRLDRVTVRHRLSVDIPGGLPPVAADIGRLGEVLTNLVENAAKYSPEGSRIELRARPNSHNVLVSVADEGRGIPEELHGRVFDRFYRVKNGGNGSGRKGTGLGLAICQGIVEAHKGRIWVESAEGEGAIFSFTLPVN